MGARNVAAALALGRQLPHPTKLVLVQMALQTRDDDEQPRYWGGWEPLAHVLGKDVPPEDDTPETKRVRGNQCSEINRHMRRLEESGLIARSRQARLGRNQECVLRLTIGPASAENPSSASAHCPTSASAERPTELVHTALPEEESGGLQEDSQDYPPPVRNHPDPSPDANGDDSTINGEQPARGDARTYVAAHAALMRLPDRGAAAIERARGELGDGVPLADCYIHAAQLVREEVA